MTFYSDTHPGYESLEVLKKKFGNDLSIPTLFTLEMFEYTLLILCTPELINERLPVDLARFPIEKIRHYLEAFQGSDLTTRVFLEIDLEQRDPCGFYYLDKISKKDNLQF